MSCEDFNQRIKQILPSSRPLNMDQTLMELANCLMWQRIMSRRGPELDAYFSIHTSVLSDLSRACQREEGVTDDVYYSKRLQLERLINEYQDHFARNLQGGLKQ